MTADDVLPTTAKRKRRKAHNEAAARSESIDADVVDIDMDGLMANDTEEHLQTGSRYGVDGAEIGEIGATQMDARTVIDLEVDPEEEKPKPVLNLTYQGFNIYGHCLCVVVEPWPVIQRSMTSLSNPKRKAGSALFQQTTSRPRDRSLSEDDLEEDEERVELSGTIEIPDGDSDFDGTGGMMEFSQVLHSIGDSRAGATNDDDDMDGSVLFGDADEFRELY